ncbi:MAG: DegT/DnrJ/EryC1/StrS family aminotransferase [Deltaproteobacteria bacterium]|nr:DegT/DnrJ/EryC1/StrS family aminotransferase [Deltaproteobacteria bacterium]
MAPLNTKKTKREPGTTNASSIKIPLTRPYMNEAIKKKVCEVLESGYLTEGPVTKAFENALRDFVGCAHAIAVTSCTVGLELALRALNVGPGDEVIVPDYTYPATADAVAIVGATVVLVDVSRDSMLIDYDSLEQAITERTRAVIPVSLFGNPLDYDRLNEMKKKHGVYIIEDAACSIGASYKGVKVGNLADISVFSLHPRKFITTGEGGIITTNNPEWAEWMLSYKHFGLRAENTSRLGSSFQMVGTNYKLSDVLAAIGLVQMEVIDELLGRRREIAQKYISLLADIKAISLPKITNGGTHSYQSFCIFVEERDEIMHKMRASGIEVQIGTYSLHREPAFASGRGCEMSGSLSGSGFAYSHCLALPFYHQLGPKDLEKVVEQLKRALR